MENLRSLFGSYSVTIIGDLKIGSKIETTDKDGYYVMDFCGTVIDIVNGAITMDNGRNTVTSGTSKLNGATIEVM